VTPFLHAPQAAEYDEVMQRALGASEIAVPSGIVSLGVVSKMLLHPDATNISTGTRRRILITPKILDEKSELRVVVTIGWTLRR